MQPTPSDPLSPDLREAAETLEQALAEACAAQSAHDADTGELIRVEEMLALASDAARRAISIRRKARHMRGAAAAEPLQPARADDAVADQPGTASHRFFDDKQGTSWDVWAVYPEGRPSQLSALPAAFQSGWLVFESKSEKRRLSPIPGNWQALPAADLERLCERAEAAPPRRARKRGGGAADASPQT